MNLPGRLKRNITEAVTRVDLHLHSYASGMATNWWVKRLGLGSAARESYTRPEDAYRMAKQAGMDFVTLTDHETIEGARALVHHPDFFTGEEVRATFPEDGSSVDILVYGLDAEAHLEIQARRGNVYELVDYLREAGLVHVLAHPMYTMGGPLDRAGVEKRLVLFGLWEFVNGSCLAEQNRFAAEVAAGVGPTELRQMAARHGLRVPPHRAIFGTGGSDDHGGFHGGTTYTVVPKVHDTQELLAAIAAGEVLPAGEDGSVAKMAHTGLKIAGAASRERRAQSAARRAGILFWTLRSALPLPPTSTPEHKLLKYLPRLTRLDGPAIRRTLAGRYERRIAETLRAATDLALLGSIGDLVDGHLLIAPYVGVHGYFGRERNKTRALRRELFAGARRDLKVGVFVDGLDGTHGVATIYRNLQARARERDDGRLCFVRCEEGAQDGGVSLRQIATLPVPLYEGMELGVPSLLDVLDHIADEGYDVLHVASPGPLGLTALVAGLILGIPVVGAYHAELGSYARVLAGDAFVAEIVEVAVRKFYERCAAVAVPSQAIACALRDRGYRVRRIEVLQMNARIGRAAREVTEGLDWDVALDGLVALHQEVVGMRPDLCACNVDEEETDLVQLNLIPSPSPKMGEGSTMIPSSSPSPRVGEGVRG